MKARTPDLRSSLRIGARFLLSFDDPAAGGPPYHGRLQELRPDGCLCIDAPSHFQPQRGTPITLRSLEPAHYSFSSEVMGCHCLHGRLPVLLVKPPRRLEKPHNRAAYRVSVCLRAAVEWREGEEVVRDSAVVANLSGGGAQVFLRRRPAAQELCLELSVPDGFVEETARRQLMRSSASLPNPALFRELFLQSCERIRAAFGPLRARLVHAQVHQEDQRGPLYALSLAFASPHDGCFRLVRYLERQAIRKGVHGDGGFKLPRSLAQVA